MRLSFGFPQGAWASSPWSERQFQTFEGPALVACEQARTSAGGKHAQMPPRADAPVARPRPAPGGRCEQHRVGSVPVYGIPAGLRIDHLYIPCTGELRAGSVTAGRGRPSRGSRGCARRKSGVFARAARGLGSRPSGRWLSGSRLPIARWFCVSTARWTHLCRCCRGRETGCDSVCAEL